MSSLPFRVLIISNCPLSYHQGSGYVILNLFNGLKRLGHDVTIYGPEQYEPFYRIRTAKVYKVALGMLILTARKLWAGFDIIVYFGAESWLPLLIFKKIFRLKLLMVNNSNGLETRYMCVMEEYFGHIGNHHQRRFSTDPRPLFDKAFRWSDGVISNNEKDRLYGLEKGYQPHDRMLSIDLGIENEYLGIETDFANTKTIGFCGSWILRKGIEHIRVAMEQFLVEEPDFRFLIIGVGDKFEKENEFSCKITGQITVVPEVRVKTELIRMYRTISIFLLPSVYESFGLVAAEAMACGCALIAADTGFASSLKPDEEAIVLRNVTGESLYRALTFLAANEDKRRKIAECGYARVQSLRWDDSIRKIESAYREWVSKG